MAAEQDTSSDEPADRRGPPAMRENRRKVRDELGEFVAAAREGDRTAFDELVRRTYDDTMALAQRLTGNAEDADDVAQETYLRAFRYLRRFRGDSQFSTWLYRITANCAATQVGRRRRHRHDVLADDSPVAQTDPHGDPALRADASALQDEVEAALATLPRKLRDVVILREMYDLSHQAIGQRLGISETAAKVRLHRARRRLRELVFDLSAETVADEDEAVTDAL
ncbi:MAG: RNA polymerase sigma factor [Acidimicrobiales bacterium]|nr:RNA polymerase sigma factor [Acidimicrobiales bacterium]